MMILNALILSLFAFLHLALTQQEVNLFLLASGRDLNIHSGTIHDVLNVKCVYDVLNVVT